MNEEHTYGNYNGDDIRRYLEGRMSPAEMHRMERAALDDPFLADAIEGFELSGSTQVKEDLAELGNRLSERTNPAGKNRFVWWRIAAMLVLVLGASTAAWYLSRPVVEHPAIAKVEELRPLPHPDTLSAPQLFRKDTTATFNRNEQPMGILPPQPETAKSLSPANAKMPAEAKGLSAKAGEENSHRALTPAEVEKEKPATEKPVNDVIALSKEPEIAKAGAKSKAVTVPAIQEKTAEEKNAEPSRSDAVSSAPAARSIGATPSYYFKGRITDEHNKPVPYASIRISNSAGNGTYTDVQGRFTMVSSDSIVKAEIRSVGYDTKKMALVAQRDQTVIRLQSAASSMDEVVVSGNGKKQAVKDEENNDSTQTNRTMPFAEPEDGWSLFDIYIKNNLRIPSAPGVLAIKGTVTVSFYVSPENGRLSDFRIEKSLGPAQDKEAIRVLKEGPPWVVVNTPKGIRTSYTIVF